MGSLCTASPTTSTYSPNPTALNEYQNILTRANNVAGTPYQPYGGQMVAGLDPTQQAGINNVNNASGIAQPYLNTAAGYAGQGAAPVDSVSANDISRYESPYQNDVINATMANINEVNGQQQNQLRGNAASAGALGGDRLGVAQAELARQQSLTSNQTLAGLNNQNYAQALGEANSQQQNAQANAGRLGQAAFTFGNLGTTAQNSALQGANAQLGAGSVAQNNQQQQLSALYQQYLQQQGFPYQQTSWLAGLAGPLAGGLGGTQTTQPPSASPFAQIAGLGLAGAGLFAKDGGRIPFADGGSAPNFMTDAPSYIPKVSLQIQRPQMMNTGSTPQQNPFGFLTPQNVKSGMGGFKNLMGGASNWNTSLPEGGSFTGGLGGDVTGGSDGGDFAHGGLVRAVHAIRKSLRRYDDGGTVENPSRPEGIHILKRKMGGVQGPLVEEPLSPFWVDHYKNLDMQRSQNISGTVPRGHFGYDDGGAVPEEPMMPGHGGIFGGLPGWAPDERPMGWEGMAPDRQLAPAAAIAEAPPESDEGGLPPGASAFAPVGPRPAMGGMSPLPAASPFDATGGAPPPEGGPSTGAPPPQTGSMISRLFGQNGGMSSDDKRALLSAGLGILGAPGGMSGLQAIGQGGLQGLKEAALGRKETELKRQHDQAMKFQKMKLDQAAQVLAEKAFEHAQNLSETQRQHDTTPIVMGENSYGQKVYGVRDRKSGQLVPLDPNTGLPRADASPQVGQPTFGTPNTMGEPVKVIKGADAVIPANERGVPQTTADDMLPSEARYVAGETPTGINPDVLTANPDIAGTVKAIAEGRQAIPTGRPLQTPYWRKVMETLNQYDSSFDQTKLPARRNMRVSYLGGGKASDNIASFNMGLQHVGELEQAARDLNNYAIAPSVMNPVVNSARGQFSKEYQAAKARFEKAADAVAVELMRAFRGTGSGSVHEVESWRRGLKTDDSPVTLLAGTQEGVKLLGGRIESQGDRWNSSMGAASQRDPLSWLSPKARETYDRVMSMDPTTDYKQKSKTSPVAKKPAGDRFNELIGSGLTKEHAYSKMHEEGF